MDKNENKTDFTYEYSAKEQEEIKRIRERYKPKEPTAVEDKMSRLRRLDESATKKATVIALILGVLGTLVLGLGMSIVMTDIAKYFGGGIYATVLGIVLGVIGIASIALAYPIYNFVTARERERIAPEIIKLTDELMK